MTQLKKRQIILKYIALILSTFLLHSLNAQQLVLVDDIKVPYGFINDISVDQYGQRYYLCESLFDSIVINENVVYLKERGSFPNAPYRFGRTYFFGVNNDSLFAKSPGGSGLFSSDTSVTHFTTIQDTIIVIFQQDTFLHIMDTLFLPDTLYTGQASGPGSNLVALEYDFNGNVLNSKHWSSPYNCHMSLEEFDQTYFSGDYIGNSGGLLLDNHFLDIGSGNGNGFIGAMDANKEVLWLNDIRGVGTEQKNIFATNVNGNILLTGYSSSGKVHFCGDSLENQAQAIWGSNFPYFIQFDAFGNCINKKTIDYNFGESFPNAVSSLSDGSYIVSGQYLPPYIGFDSLYLYKSYSGYSSFLVKFSDDLQAQAVFQMEGSPGNKHLLSMITDNDDNVLICGYSPIDTLMIGNQTLINTTGDNSAFGFLAVLDANFNVTSAIKLAGRGHKLVSGKDGNSYLLEAVDFGVNHYKLHRIDNLTNNLITQELSGKDIEINLFPNPVLSGQYLHYQLASQAKLNIEHIKISDIFGRTISVVSNTENEGLLDLKRATGMLILEFYTDNNSKIVKKVVAH